MCNQRLARGNGEVLMTTLTADFTKLNFFFNESTLKRWRQKERRKLL